MNNNNTTWKIKFSEFEEDKIKFGRNSVQDPFINTGTIYGDNCPSYIRRSFVDVKGDIDKAKIEAHFLNKTSVIINLLVSKIPLLRLLKYPMSVLPFGVRNSLRIAVYQGIDYQLENNFSENLNGAQNNVFGNANTKNGESDWNNIIQAIGDIAWDTILNSRIFDYSMDNDGNLYFNGKYIKVDFKTKEVLANTSIDDVENDMKSLMTFDWYNDNHYITLWLTKYYELKNDSERTAFLNKVSEFSSSHDISVIKTLLDGLGGRPYVKWGKLDKETINHFVFSTISAETITDFIKSDKFKKEFPNIISEDNSVFKKSWELLRTDERTWNNLKAKAIQDIKIKEAVDTLYGWKDLAWKELRDRTKQIFIDLFINFEDGITLDTRTKTWQNTVDISANERKIHIVEDETKNNKQTITKLDSYLKLENHKLVPAKSFNLNGQNIRNVLYLSARTIQADEYIETSGTKTYAQLKDNNLATKLQIEQRLATISGGSSGLWKKAKGIDKIIPTYPIGMAGKNLLNVGAFSSLKALYDGNKDLDGKVDEEFITKKDLVNAQLWKELSKRPQSTIEHDGIVQTGVMQAGQYLLTLNKEKEWSAIGRNELPTKKAIEERISQISTSGGNSVWTATANAIKLQGANQNKRVELNQNPIVITSKTFNTLTNAHIPNKAQVKEAILEQMQITESQIGAFLIESDGNARLKDTIGNVDFRGKTIKNANKVDLITNGGHVLVAVKDYVSGYGDNDVIPKKVIQELISKIDGDILNVNTIDDAFIGTMKGIL